MPKISLVAPVYGVEKYIHQFLDSIREQTFEDYEAILVDDGSKDNCSSILDEFALEDRRYKVIHQENGGVSKARNTGLSYAAGDYVYIVDSDDWLEPTALESLWKEARRTGADIIYGDWVEEMPDSSIRQFCFPRAFVTDEPATIEALQFAVNSNNNRIRIHCPEFSEIRHLGGAPWRGMFKRTILQENNLWFDPYVKGLGDDILFTLHLYEYVRKIAYTPEVLYHYRELDSSYTHGFKANYLENMERIFEKQEQFLKKYKKGKFAYQAYYVRVLIYLQQGMARYFLNMENPKSERERYVEFLETIKKEPYRTAIKKAPLRYMGTKRLPFTSFLLRYGMCRAYWKLAVK